jgi:hypothetical protein
MEKRVQNKVRRTNERKKLNVKVVIMCVGSVCCLAASLLHYLLALIQTHTKDPQSDQRKLLRVFIRGRERKRKLPSMLFQ